MLDSFSQLAFPVQALIATLFTWALTSLGACVVFFMRQPNRNVMDAMLGLAGGVMVAAAFWSLLSPSIDMSASLGMNPWLTALIGFMGGGVLLFLGDRLFTRFSERRALLRREDSGRKAGFKRCAMLVFSITLHNIPEGMAVGVVLAGLRGSGAISAPAAMALSVGIAIQNLPEGMAVSVPLRREGYSRGQSFFYGQLSGVVEPIAAVLGALLVLKVRTCLPFLLAFAAGAMIYVVVEEVVPEANASGNGNLATISCIAGVCLVIMLSALVG